MKNRTVLLSAIAVAAMLAFPIQYSEASSGWTVYSSQLDENGSAVYSSLGSAGTGYSDTIHLDVPLPVKVLYPSEQEAKKTVLDSVNDAFAAKYLDDPMFIWLWDYPIKDISADTAVETVTAGESGTYYFVSSVSFDLSVPERFAGKTESVMKEIENSGKTFTGSESSVSKSIVGYLSNVKVREDSEGTVSCIYDALCEKSSSYPGIAAAFNYLASSGGLKSVTVCGNYYSQDKSEVRYWNAVSVNGMTYASDAAGGLSACGLLSDVPGGIFSSVYGADLDVMKENGLSAPELEREGFQYPDDTPFLEKYGAYIILLIISAVLVIAMFKAVRDGSV